MLEQKYSTTSMTELIKIVVIPTDEEVMIARDAYDICLK